MSFSTYEESVELGEPTTLYLFRFGSDPLAFFAYCSHTEEITVGSGPTAVTYSPLPIIHDDIVASGNADRADLTVTVPMSSEIAELFRFYPPGQVVALTIRQGHLNDPDTAYPAVWVGRALGAARGESIAEITCQSIGTSLKRAGLPRHYQIGCPHMLYGDDCKASKPAVQVISTVAGVSAASVTLPAGWNGALDPQKFVAGMVSWAGLYGVDARTILRVTGNVLSLTGPTGGLTLGGPITVLPGCNHQTTDCETLHANILNYGGQPYIPSDNPLGMNVYN